MLRWSSVAISRQNNDTVNLTLTSLLILTLALSDHAQRGVTIECGRFDKFAWRGIVHFQQFPYLSKCTAPENDLNFPVAALTRMW